MYGLPHRHALFRAARARGLGASDVMTPVDPVAVLISQVNRFTGPKAPAEYRVAPGPFQLASGNLGKVAPVAVVLYQRAATDSYNQYGDRGSALQIEKANKGFADPAGFVSTNMSEVTGLIANLADSIGLPESDGGSGMTRTLLIIGGVALAAWMLSR